MPRELIAHGLPDAVISPPVAGRSKAGRRRVGGEVGPEVRLAGAAGPERGAAVSAATVLLVRPSVVPAPRNPALLAPLLTRHSVLLLSRRGLQAVPVAAAVSVGAEG